MNWYVFQSNILGGKAYRPRSLQKDIGKKMLRLFHYLGIFYVYLFDGEDIVDVSVNETKQEALQYCNQQEEKSK